MVETQDYGNYMKDCLHLHACRLLSKRIKDAGVRYVARRCNDSCPCYQSVEIVYGVSLEDVEKIVDEAVRMRDMGYGHGDYFAPQDCDEYERRFIYVEGVTDDYGRR